MPSPALAARYGQSIEFRLTVTDNDAPAATDSTTVTFNINQGPIADIAVTAILADPANPDVVEYDDNGNGDTDENAEKYPLDGVIDAPGENGNADNEWDIAEGALITLDGSGSSDPNGTLESSNYSWSRVYVSTETAYEVATAGDLLNSLLVGNDDSDTLIDGTDSGASSGAVVSTDEDPRADATDRAAEVMIPLVSDAATRAGRPAPPFFVYYKLTVTDSNTQNPAMSSAVVKIVIHDQPKDPVIDSIVPSVTRNAGDTADLVPGSAISDETGAPGSGRYIIAPRSAITLTPTVAPARAAIAGATAVWDADGDTPAVTWEGANDSNPTSSVAPATFTAPATAEEGDEFTITATATDITGRMTTSSVTLVVATNTAPEAVAPGTLATSRLFSSIVVNDGPDGGDIDPLTRKGTGVVNLRGISHDADGDALFHVWTELAMAPNASPSGTPGVNDTVVLPAFVDPTAASPVPNRATFARPIRLPAEPLVSIDGATSQNASFAVPEVNARHTKLDITEVQIGVDLNDDGDSTDTDPVTVVPVPIAYTVLDAWQVKTTRIVIVFIRDTDDVPRANAGPSQQVTPGSFVRLNGAGSSDADPGDRLSHQWTYAGIATDPLTQNRPAITPAEIGMGYVEGTWFPYDGIVQVATADGSTQNVAVFSDYTFTAEPGANGVYAVGSVTTANAGGPAGPGTDGELGTADDIIQVEPGVLTAATANDDTTPQNETQGDAPRGSYHPTAGGKLKNSGSAFPYFDAPRLGGFNSIKLRFSLVVTDGLQTVTPTDPLGVNRDSSTNRAVVTITITDGFYSGNVNGPDFCLAQSLGGHTTYPFDSDFDGVADTCSLNTTRRATVARQNAMETLAALNPDTFKNHLHGATLDLNDPPTPNDATDDTTIPSQCALAPRNLGDDPGDLANDSCGRVGTFNRVVSAPPRPVDPAKADEFFSGVITGPNFCANDSLGGSTTYAFDSDGDGVADICSLPFTSREAVARQNALNAAFGPDSGHEQYADALKAACTALGSSDFGDSAAALATDECSRPPAPTTGTRLPTS